MQIRNINTWKYKTWKEFYDVFEKLEHFYLWISMELSEPWFSGILPDAGWGKTNVTIKTPKKIDIIVFPSVLTLFHALKWSRKSSKVFCSNATIVMLRRQDEFGSFRCFSIAVKMALIDSFGEKPPRPAENKIITQGLIFPHSALRSIFFYERNCLLSCLFQSQEWPELWPFWPRRGSEPFPEMMWCLRRCPAQPSVR